MANYLKNHHNRILLGLISNNSSNITAAAIYQFQILIIVHRIVNK